MQRTVAHYQSPTAKSQIRFIRNLAAPKQIPHRSTIPSSHQVSSTLPHSPFTLSLNLTLPDKTIESVTFGFNERAKVNELILFIKQKIQMDCVYFTSGNILLDYFLTLPNRFVAEITTSKLNLNVHIVQVDESISLRSVQIIKCIGSGGFSKVLLARVYGITMAIKVIDKDFIFKTAKQSLVENEKTILQMSEGHPFITKLFFSFQTNKFVIFGMEYCSGGQLFNLLKRVKKMKQNDAKFYFIQTLMAIEFLHANGILYRDLKPENIIIDSEGHLRLADFGLSKIINRSITYSFCGSAEYISPQMLLKKGHSYQVDYYCLGALIYELVTGLPPFYTHNQTQLFDNILNHPLSFPQHAKLSDELKCFLQKILQKQPEKRFQSVSQILADPWVSKDFDRQAVLSKKLIPPFPAPIFNYNFDDSDLNGQQNQIFRQVQSEIEFVGDNIRHYTDMYYESKDIVAVRKQVESMRVRSFLKVKSQSKNQVYFHNRESSDHKRKISLPRSSEKAEVGHQRIFLERSSTLEPTKIHIRSANSLKTIFHNPMRTLQTKVLAKSNYIYMNKPRFSPNSTVYRSHKLSNHQYTRYMDRSLEYEMNSSLSKQKMPKSGPKQKVTEASRNFSYKGDPISFNSRNYLANKDKRMTKVKKSSKHIQKINFNFASSIYRS